MSARKKRPRARPLELERVITTTDEGDEITVADRIVIAVRGGVPVDVAAAAAGVAKSTLLDYLRVGARTRAKLTADHVEGDFTAKELACADLSDRVFVAQAEFEVRTLTTVDKVARGGIPMETITVKHELLDDSGEMVETERKVVTSKTLPDWRAAMQRLVYRHPDRYARNRLEHYFGDAPSLEPDLDEDEALSIAIKSFKSLPSLPPIDLATPGGSGSSS